MISPELKKFILDNFKNQSVVCLSGAGISYESGIPTFRGKDGLWSRYDPQTYSTAEGLASVLRRYPGKFVDFIVDLYSVLQKARPNDGHLSLMILEKEGILSAVITQNVDNLHQKAGSRNVIELHGNAHRIKCPNCQNTLTLEEDRITEMLKLLKRNKGSRIKLLRVLSRYFPRCKCGSRFRIDIVLFGEMLPQEAMSSAYRELDRCKVLLLVGTSLAVYPAAGLPLYAKKHGAALIEINNQPSALSQYCNYRIISDSGKALSEIVNILGYA